MNGLSPCDAGGGSGRGNCPAGGELFTFMFSEINRRKIHK